MPTAKQNKNHKRETTYLNNSVGLVIFPSVCSLCLRRVNEQIPPLPWQQNFSSPWSFQLANRIRVRLRQGAPNEHISTSRKPKRANKQRNNGVNHNNEELGFSIATGIPFAASFVNNLAAHLACLLPKRTSCKSFASSPGRPQTL